MKIFVLFIVFVFSTYTYAGCVNEINSTSELVISNVCAFENTVLVRIDDVSMEDWYNPSSYFKPHRTYRYEASVLESIKGNTKDKLCFVELIEGENHPSIGVEYIVSFTSAEDCSLIDVGGKVKVTDSLLEDVRRASKLKNPLTSKINSN